MSISYITDAQDVILRNPSFEDKPRRGTYDQITGKRSTPIKGWYDCGQIYFPRATPPDIHDGQTDYWNTEVVAAQGKTYMTMVVREDDSFESVSQKLIGTLKAGQCYKFSIQLIRSKTYLSPTQNSREEKNFTQPAVFRLYGGNSSCDNAELLAESPPIDNEKWQKYEFKVNPNGNYTHISLVAYFVVPTAFGYNGHICLDDASKLIEIDCDEDVTLVAEAEQQKPVKKAVPSFKRKKPEETVVVQTKNKKENKVDTIVYTKPKKKILEDLDRKKLVMGQLIKLEHLHFKADSSNITDVSYGVLNEVYDFLNTYQEVKIEVGGHTNNVPQHDYCDKLSTERAQAVAKYLISKGIDEDRITYKGYGKRKPLVKNRTEEARRKNQRVQIKITSLG